MAKNGVPKVTWSQKIRVRPIWRKIDLLLIFGYFSTLSPQKWPKIISLCVSPSLLLKKVWFKKLFTVENPGILTPVFYNPVSYKCKNVYWGFSFEKFQYSISVSALGWYEIRGQNSWSVSVSPRCELRNCYRTFSPWMPENLRNL